MSFFLFHYAFVAAAAATAFAILSWMPFPSLWIWVGKMLVEKSLPGRELAHSENRRCTVKLSWRVRFVQWKAVPRNHTARRRGPAEESLPAHRSPRVQLRGRRSACKPRRNPVSGRLGADRGAKSVDRSASLDARGKGCALGSADSRPSLASAVCAFRSSNVRAGFRA